MVDLAICAFARVADLPFHSRDARPMNKAQAATKLEPMQRLGEFQRWEKGLLKLPNSVIRSSVPLLAWFAKPEIRSTVDLELAAAGIAVERFRLKLGRWPESLNDVVEAKLLAKAPIDPYAGGQLSFRKTKDGVVLYSVGPDGKGAGNDLENPNPNETRLEFRLWNKEQRRQPPRAKQ
jgi:hypothetical protein